MALRSNGGLHSESSDPQNMCVCTSMLRDNKTNKWPHNIVARRDTDISS